MSSETELTYSEDVEDYRSSDDAEELKEGIKEAERHLSHAENVEIIARSCQFGWKEYLEELRYRLDTVVAAGDDEEDEVEVQAVG